MCLRSHSDSRSSLGFRGLARHRRPSIAIAVLLLALQIPALALAAPKQKAKKEKEDWSKAFPPEAALQARDFFKGLAVVPAGTGAEGAASALIDAVKAQGFKTKDIPARLRNDPAKNDKAILSALDRAGIRPGRVAIVRVYPGTKGRRASAVVLIYDKKKARVSSLIGEEGGSGTPDQPQALAAEQYSKQVLWYGTHLMPEPGTVAVDDSFNLVFQGTGGARRAIGWGEFYRLVGRPELARKYRTRLRLSYGAVAAGLVSLGVVAAIDDWDVLWPVAAVSSVAVVGGAMGVGRANPASRSETLEMIDEHNTKLRVRLGIAHRDGALEPEVSLAVRF